MRGEYIHILCEDLWCASRSWSDACLGREKVYVYHVMDTHKLIAATLRYGWRVTPHTT